MDVECTGAFCFENNWKKVWKIDIEFRKYKKAEKYKRKLSMLDILKTA